MIGKRRQRSCAGKVAISPFESERSHRAASGQVEPLVDRKAHPKQ
jgi:hypothetical protein